MRGTAALRLADTLHASALVRAGCRETDPLTRTSAALCTMTEERGQSGREGEWLYSDREREDDDRV